MYIRKNSFKSLIFFANGILFKDPFIMCLCMTVCTCMQVPGVFRGIRTKDTGSCEVHVMGAGNVTLVLSMYPW